MEAAIYAQIFSCCINKLVAIQIKQRNCMDRFTQYNVVHNDFDVK